jgi:large subunit ribosomal protein L33
VNGKSVPAEPSFRRILVKLISTALTGFFYTTTRPRLGEKLAMMKYDPMGAWPVLFQVLLHQGRSL